MSLAVSKGFTVTLKNGDNMVNARITDGSSLSGARLYNYSVNHGRKGTVGYQQGLTKLIDAIGWNPNDTLVEVRDKDFSIVQTANAEKVLEQPVAPKDAYYDRFELKNGNLSVKCRMVEGEATGPLDVYRANGQRYSYRLDNLNAVIKHFNIPLKNTDVIFKSPYVDSKLKPLTKVIKQDANPTVTIPPVNASVTRAFHTDNARTIKQDLLMDGNVLHVYYGEEHIASARILGDNYRLYAYKHNGEHLGKKGKFFKNIHAWLDTFDEDAYKLDVRVCMEDGSEPSVELF